MVNSILSVFTASYILKFSKEKSMEKSQSFSVIQLVVISVSLVGRFIAHVLFTGIHEVVLFGESLFFVGTLLLYIFKKKIW